jgi:hypothetical protein
MVAFSLAVIALISACQVARTRWEFGQGLDAARWPERTDTLGIGDTLCISSGEDVFAGVSVTGWEISIETSGMGVYMKPKEGTFRSKWKRWSTVELSSAIVTQISVQRVALAVLEFEQELDVE